MVTSRSPAPLDAGTPRPRTRKVRPDLVPAGTLSVTGPSRVGTVTLAPRVASGKRHRHRHGQVLAPPAEHRVAVGVHDHVQVPGRAAAAPGAAPGLHPDALAVLDAGGNADLDLAGPVLDAGPVAGRAGMLTRMPVPRAAWQGWLNENRPWLSLITPRPRRRGRPSEPCPAPPRCPRRYGRPLRR